MIGNERIGKDEKVRVNELNSIKNATTNHLLSYINKEIKSFKKRGRSLSIEKTLQKLQKAIDSNKTEDLLKVLNRSRRVVLGIVVDLQVAEQAAERMDVRYVVPILDAILKRIEENPRVLDEVMGDMQSGNHLFPWLHAILYCHCTYTSTIPDLKTKFTFFHRLLDTRANTYTRLLKLNGRLALFKELTSSADLEHNSMSMEIEGIEEDI